MKLKPNITYSEVAKHSEEIATAEQSADLAALQAAAAEAEPAPAEQAQAGPDLAAELTGLITAAVAALGPLFPSLRATYTPEVTQAAAESVARVCHKHGWLEGGVMGKWGEEIACLAIVGPLAFQTYQGCKADIDARKPKPEAARIAAGSTAPGKAVQFGTVQHVEPLGAAA